MAGAGRRTFTPGEVLTASNVMNYLQDQAVMNFAGTAARGSAIGTAVSEGMVSYLADLNQVQVYDGSAWQQVYPAKSLTGNIVQVVSATKTDTASIASGVFTDISGLSVSITPTSSTNKILVFTRLNFGVSADEQIKARVMRFDSNVVDLVAFARFSSTAEMRNYAGIALDSPASTSATTYKVQWLRELSATAYLNRRGFDTPANTYSSITVMEVVA